MAKEIELTPFEQQVQAVSEQHRFHWRLAFIARTLALLCFTVGACWVGYNLLRDLHPSVWALLGQVVLALFAVTCWEFSSFQHHRAEAVFKQLYPKGD